MRRGMTLIELLIVCFIIVLFVAVAAPLLRPNTADIKVREASRQVNAFFAQAKAYAAQRQKNVAVVFDRRTAITEAARDSNIVTRLYLAESPPTYAGDTLGATVALWEEPGQPIIPGFCPTPPSLPHRLITLDFGPMVNPMMEVITKSYFSNPPVAGETMPFTIRLSRFNNPSRTQQPSPQPDVKGPAYPAIAIVSPTGSATGIQGREIQYFLLAQYNQPAFKEPLDQTPNPYPGAVVPTSACFSVTFPPIPSPGSHLDLPTGACVDLQFSGIGTDASFYDPTRSNGSPLSVIFSPSGEVWKVQTAQSLQVPMGRLHFLVGQTKLAIDSGPALVVPGSNIGDPGNYWTSVNSRTGLVQTANNSTITTNLPPADPNYWPTVIQQARSDALAFSTKGGR